MEEELERISEQLAEIDRTLHKQLGSTMASAPPRLVAGYGPHGGRTTPVVAFDDRGALVIDERTGRFDRGQHPSQLRGLAP